MGQLSGHANVITPYRSGYTDDGNPYLVMEYVEGGSLSDHLDQRGPIEWRQAVIYACAIADALGQAHKQSILHRDVKPANILVGEDAVARLTDFGISAVQGSTATAMAFTLAHSPPETFTSGTDARDERSDLYSLASTLYMLVTGRIPFAADGDDDSQHAMMRRIETHDPPVLPEESAPSALARFLVDAMAKDPARRPQSAEEFRNDLEQILTDETYVARPAPDQATRPVTPPLVAPQSIKGQALVDASPLRAPGVAAGLPWWRQGRMVASVAALSVFAVAGFLAVSQVREVISEGSADFAAPDAASEERDSEVSGDEPNVVDESADDPQVATTTVAPEATTATSTTTAPAVPDEPVVISATSDVESVAVMADGRIVVGGADGSLTVVGVDEDGTASVEAQLVDQDELVFALLSLPDGRVVSGGADAVARIRDLSDPGNPETFAGHEGFTAAIVDLALLPDGRVASASWDQTVQVWDPADPEAEAIRFEGHTALVEAVAVLPDGRVVSAGRDGIILAWDPDDPAESTVIGTVSGTILSLAALSDGRVVAGGLDGDVTIWDPAGAGSVVGYEGHSGNVSAIVELPDGRVATGSWDGTVQVWDPDRPGASGVVFDGHQGQVTGLAVQADGTGLVSVADDATIRLWDPDQLG